MTLANTPMEVLALRVTVAILSLIPISTGLAGIVLGPSFLGAVDDVPADLDSHVRFLSGVFITIGIVFLWMSVSVEQHVGRFRLLSAMVFVGGLARLLSLFLVGTPSAGHVAGLALELVAVPFLVLWQTSVAGRVGTAI